MSPPGEGLAVAGEPPVGRFGGTGRAAAEELFTACYPRLTGWVRRWSTMTRPRTRSPRRHSPGCWPAGPGLTIPRATCT